MHPPFHPSFPFHLIGMVLRFVLLFGGAFLLLRYYLKNRGGNKVESPGNEDRKVILPLRLQAFERFVLFLERIHPSNLLMRQNSAGLTAVQLQSLLVRAIREEFEYNLSQQLYISPASWEMVKNAKEETISLINQSTARVGEESQASALVKEIFDQAVAKGKLPVDAAIEGIKREMQQMF